MIDQLARLQQRPRLGIAFARSRSAEPLLVLIRTDAPAPSPALAFCQAATALTRVRRGGQHRLCRGGDRRSPGEHPDRLLEVGELMGRGPVHPGDDRECPARQELEQRGSILARRAGPAAEPQRHATPRNLLQHRHGLDLDRRRPRERPIGGLDGFLQPLRLRNLGRPARRGTRDHLDDKVTVGQLGKQVAEARAVVHSLRKPLETRLDSLIRHLLNHGGPEATTSRCRARLPKGAFEARPSGC